MTMAPSLLVTLLLTASVPPDESASAAWRYVLPAPGDPFEHPPLRALGLGREKPEDVVERVAYRGGRRRYGQIRYGSPGSVRVAVVLDEVAPGEADLYVDADRNRRIEPKDRATGEGRTWHVPLDVAIVEGDTVRYERRAAVFRLGSTGLTLGSAAAGYFEGAVRVGGRDHVARRTDGDVDGRLNGAQDRIWIDLDDDGRWDPVAEQFLFAAILSVGGGRYAARSDEFGGRLALEPLEGTGTVRLAAVRLGAPVAELSAMLIGRDGSAVGLAGAGGEATVPVDEYRLGTVTLALQDPAGGPRWGYVFSDNGRRGEPVWYRVARGAAVSIDPLGAVELATGLDGSGPRKPGEDLDVRPRLYTGDGLLIVTCYRGTPTAPGGDDGPTAGIALSDGGGRTLATARSGFA
jgi:hypothetical protein